MNGTRREFLQVAAGSLAAWAVPSLGSARWAPCNAPGASLALHMDSTFFARGDCGMAYLPRGVTGGALALASLDEAELRMRHPWL